LSNLQHDNVGWSRSRQAGRPIPSANRTNKDIPDPEHLGTQQSVEIYR